MCIRDSRLDEIVYYKSLTKDEMRKIVDLQLQDLRNRMAVSYTHLVQVVLALGFLDGGIGLLDLLTQALHLANGVLLVLPLCLRAAELILQFGKFLSQILQDVYKRQAQTTR